MINKKKFVSPSRRNGFTLIEMLLVVSLLAVISLAVFQAFANGLKIWKKGYEARTEKDIFIFFEKLSQDLHNSFVYSLIPFDGKESAIAFSAIVHIPQDAHLSHGENIYIDQMGKVKYYFDSLKNNICRQQAGYGRALKDRFAKEEILISGIQSLRFLYDYHEGGSFLSRETGRETFPSYLQVAVVYGDPGNPKKIQRSIPIPIGH